MVASRRRCEACLRGLQGAGARSRVASGVNFSRVHTCRLTIELQAAQQRAAAAESRVASIELQRNEAQAKLVEACAASDAMRTDIASAAAAARIAEAMMVPSILLQQTKQAEFNMRRFSSAKAAHGGGDVVPRMLVATNSLFDVTHV